MIHFLFDPTNGRLTFTSDSPVQVETVISTGQTGVRDIKSFTEPEMSSHGEYVAPVIGLIIVAGSLILFVHIYPELAETCIGYASKSFTLDALHSGVDIDVCPQEVRA